MSTWARIVARSYEEAVLLLEQLSALPWQPWTLVQSEQTWSIYVSADAAEFPAVIYGVGVEPAQVSLVDGPGRWVSAGD